LEATANLGFLTIAQDNGSYVGGYLVANQWGRPLEFRLTSAVQPNRVQQILYGPSLKPYLCADLLGKTLVEKTGTTVAAVITDCEAALDLRLSVAMPVAWLTVNDHPLVQKAEAAGLMLRCPNGKVLLVHTQFPQDVETLRTLLAGTVGLDVAEPFSRIQDALTEARKMGAVTRAA
jgi:hypothetical protein